MQQETKKEPQGYLQKLNNLDKLDKRTKEYKELKKETEKTYEDHKKIIEENQSKGLGDTIAKATKATGIEKLVKFISGEDCGCDERKAKLNELFSYDVPKCLNEDEFDYLTKLIANKPAVASVDLQKQILKIHNRIFTQQIELSSCPSCLRRTIEKLEKTLKQY